MLRRLGPSTGAVHRRWLHLSTRPMQKERQRITIEDPDDFGPIDSDKEVSTDASKLFYAYRSSGEVFGQLVNEANNGRDPLHNSRVLTPEEALKGVDPRYRDSDTGELREGATSRDARLDPRTLEGRVNRARINVPEPITTAIKNNILYRFSPKNLKQRAAQYYVNLNERGLAKRAEDEDEVDVAIATTFIQNYAAAYQVIDEMKKRMPNFTPKSVLNCTYGPATGMLALNEVMGEEFNPEVKDVLVSGSFHMARRAKLLLSRQIPEQYPRDASEADALEYKEPKKESTKEQRAEGEQQQEEYIGAVKTKSLKVKSVIMSTLRPASKKYDLIIAEGRLLNDLENFPHQVDDRLDDLVHRLNPGGVLLLIERGNPVGAESIARARQVILRPENNPGRVAKIPREYKRGTVSVSGDTPDAEDEVMTGIEPEILENYDIVEEEPLNLKVVAPCPHHGPCPLQFFKPEYYLYGQIGKKLKFCSFNVDVNRPKFLMEMKKGAYLATRWTSPNSGEGIKGLAQPGKGRPYSLDYETASYSYLMVERSPEDPAVLEQLRQKEDLEPARQIGFQSVSADESPRILAQPMKRKHLVTLDLCAPSGHVEKWYISKGIGKQEYHDARKALMGDLWRLGAKSAIQSKKENTFYFARLEEKTENLRKNRKRDAQRMKRQLREQYKEAIDEEEADVATSLEGRIRRMAKIDAYRLLSNPKDQRRMSEKKR